MKWFKRTSKAHHLRNYEHKYQPIAFAEFRYRTNEEGIGFGTEVTLQCDCGERLIENYRGMKWSAQRHYAHLTEAAR